MLNWLLTNGRIGYAYFHHNCLFGILPQEDWLCWWLFVQACLIICKKTISFSECRQAQNFIVEYCEQFQQLYGKESLVINMHLACHLHECILDYGPVNQFWCFGFERFNGILGSYPNNHQHVSVTMMKKFEDCLQSVVIVFMLSSSLFSPKFLAPIILDLSLLIIVRLTLFWSLYGNTFYPMSTRNTLLTYTMTFILPMF